jgi:hypothetical protein
MRKASVLGTALTAVLLAAPGLTLAQTGNTGNNGNVAGPYAQVGMGGYSGTEMPIASNDKNNNDRKPNMRPSERNADLADNGDARAGKGHRNDSV